MKQEDLSEIARDPIKIKILKALADSRLQAAPALHISLKVGSSAVEVNKAMDDLVKRGFVVTTQSGQLYTLTYEGKRLAREFEA